MTVMGRPGDKSSVRYTSDNQRMLKDVIPFDRVWLALHGPSRPAEAVVSFIRFLERRLGAEFVYDQSRIGYAPLELAGLLELAETLRARGIIRSYGRNPKLSDEPRVAHWYTEYIAEGRKKSAGSSVDDEPLALTKALSEALERYLWYEYNQFTPLRSATPSAMERTGAIIHPMRFAGFSESQRDQDPRLTFDSASSFLWVKGYSWVREEPVWIPVQIVSGHTKFRAFSPSSKEPVIRSSITTGLATHPLQTNALLSGALEVIERDAYSITWMNQITPPRMDIEELAKRSESLARLIDRCHRYRLLPHALRLPTDAPAYAVCAVLEDTTGALPRFSVGIKANRNPASAVEGALLEALRAHLGTRQRKLSPLNDWDPETKAAAVMQYDRLLYWAEEGRGDRLAFLIRGDITAPASEPWEADTDAEHLARIVAWCRERGYELASVPFTDAAANIPGWHIEFVVLPELQPLHYNEKFPYCGGDRLTEIPRRFGYVPREPYLDDPHPFA